MSRRAKTLKLLPQDALQKTGGVDHADWNYRPMLGAISRKRFQMVVSLLPVERCERLIEIGYGSGVFMPELARHCDKLYGIDVHSMAESVRASLAKHNVAAQLSSGSAAALPFEDDFFNCVVAVSALEFVEELDAACAEIVRVLKPGCPLVIVTPGHSPLLDLGLKMMTGESANKDYGDRRQSLQPTLLKHFYIERELTAPSIGSSLIKLYAAMRLRARE
ncbi:MAG TPA: methyltransferase domain-containing protein [Pyrinomonadaceae bacterium]|nr:methyltransferase domain-containing protein [Pyrinomonadaceae bacterium]